MFANKNETKTETSLPLDENGSVDNAALAERYDEPGNRVGGNLTRIGNAAPRPAGEAVCTATLVRGISYRVSYAGRPLVFEKGKPTPINQTEFDKLVTVCDELTFHDGEHRTRRFLRKFEFADADGRPVEMEPLPDIEID